jgi:hypothetical protein
MRKRTLILSLSALLVVGLIVGHIALTAPKRRIDRFLTEVANVEIGATKLQDWREQVASRGSSGCIFLLRRGELHNLGAGTDQSLIHTSVSAAKWRRGVGELQGRYRVRNLCLVGNRRSRYRRSDGAWNRCDDSLINAVAIVPAALLHLRQGALGPSLGCRRDGFCCLQEGANKSLRDKYGLSNKNRWVQED